MLKKVLFVAAVLGIILAGGIMERNYIDCVFNDFVLQVEQLELKTHNQTIDKSDVDRLYEWWEGKEKAVDFFVPHTLVTDLRLRLAELDANVVMEEQSETFVQLLIIKSLCLRIMNVITS